MFTIRSVIKTTSLFALSVLPLSSFAETSKDVVVSASRIPVAANRVGSSITVITAKDIKQTQPATVTDILRTVPGLTVDQSGSRGGLTQVRIRGAEANHTKVIIDGVEVNDPSSGSEFNFAHLLVSNIERIEILRGPQSAIYGSDAVGGVIVIKTKRGAGKPSMTAETSAGTYKTNKTSVITRGGNKKFNYSIGAVHFETEGYSSFNETRGGVEKDGYNNDSLNMNLRFSPTDTTVFAVSFRKARAETDFDDAGADANFYGNVDKYSGKISGKVDLLDGRWTHELSYGAARTDSESLGAFGFSVAEGKKQKLAYQSSYTFAKTLNSKSGHVLVTALERVKNDTYSLTAGNRENSNLGLVLEYRYSYNKQFFASVAGRFDDNDQFKDANSGRVTLAYIPSSAKNTRLHSSYGTGVKNPTLTELYGFFGTYIGNPNLTPEKIKGWDAGIEFKFYNKKLVLDFTYFSQDVTDLIVSNATFTSSLNDIGVSKSKGLELLASWKVSSKLSLSGNYTYTDAKNASGQKQIRRPEHNLSFNLNYRPRKNTGINLSLVSKADVTDSDFSTIPATTVNLDDYAIVNLGIQHKLNKKVTITAKVENMFDEQYEEIFTFGTAGRAYYIGVRADF